MAKSIVNQMTASLAKVPGGNRTVGLIATFTQTPRDVDRGDSMSKLVDAALIAHQPQFAHAAQLPLWQAGAEGTVNLKVFFINQ
ncbi:MAG: hypothetical protein HOW97_33540 [Catenulispora sp.]|nr:hypothetical protein [Catenulispora sp.]